MTINCGHCISAGSDREVKWQKSEIAVDVSGGISKTRAPRFGVRIALSMGKNIF